MNRYKKNSRSRSRSPNHKRKDKDRQHHYSYKGGQRGRQNREGRQSRDRHRDSSPKKKKRHYSSQSPSSGSSNGSQRSKNSNLAFPYKKQQSQAPQQPRFKIEQTKTLKIQNCTEQQAAQRALTDASIAAGTSVPDEVQLKQGAIYIKYPSIEVSSKIKELLKEKIVIKGTEYRINFYPYKKIDLNIAYDWYCDKCEYKNFARRNKCYRCDNEKNNNCRFNYNTSSVVPTKNNVNANTTKEDNINNCSLMIRGPVIMDTQEQILLDLFESICNVKDIRMIKNKMTGQLKDFAFVEFFTPQEAAQALKQASSPDFRVKGQKVSVMYSRNKSEDEYTKPLPYQKKERKKDFNKKEKRSDEPIQNYYSRQRQLQIEQEKQRPMITMQQLKQKHEQELKKKAAVGRELTQQQSKRRQAELMAKQWEKQAKLQNTVMYICVMCRRKFKGQAQMKSHELNSEMHKFNKRKYELCL